MVILPVSVSIPGFYQNRKILMFVSSVVFVTIKELLKLIYVTSIIPVIVTVTDAQDCINQNVTDWTGTFQPSSYPINYAPNLDCFWLLQVSEGNLITLNFQDFSVGYLMIFTIYHC